MCLIAVKKKGTTLSPLFFKGIIKSYNLRNKDGAGFAVKKKGSIYISKGYFNISDLIKSIKSHNVQKEDELIVHLRKVSAGDRDIENCHPFVCSSFYEELHKEEGYTKYPVVAHNGTIHRFIEHASNFSDTYYFVDKKLSKAGYPRVLAFLNNHEPAIVNNLVNNSRLAIMFPGKEVTSLIGEWKVCKETGIYYSNTSYLGNKCPIHGNTTNHNYGNMCGYSGAWDERD